MFDTYRLMDIILGILIFCIMIFIIKKQGLFEKYMDVFPEVKGANKCSDPHSRDSSSDSTHYHGTCSCPDGQEPVASTGECKLCDAGSAGTGGICNPCNVLRREVAPYSGQTSCLTCRAGAIPNSTRTLCTDCPPGHGVHGSICVQCGSDETVVDGVCTTNPVTTCTQQPCAGKNCSYATNVAGNTTVKERTCIGTQPGNRRLRGRDGKACCEYKMMHGGCVQRANYNRTITVPCS
jgi:hypothetical protein